MDTCENENVQRLHKDSGSTWKNQIFPNITASPGIGDCASLWLVRILFLKIKKTKQKNHEYFECGEDNYASFYDLFIYFL